MNCLVNKNFGVPESIVSATFLIIAAAITWDSAENNNRESGRKTFTSVKIGRMLICSLI